MFFCTSCSGIRWSWTIHTTLENETKPRKHVATDCLDVSSEPMLDRLRHTTAYAQGKYTDTTNVVLYWKVSASFRWLSGASWSIQRHTNKLKTAWMVCEFNYIEYENHETQVTITSIWELCRQKQVSPEGMINYIAQFTVGCNYLSLPEIPASGNKVVRSTPQIHSTSEPKSVRCL